MQDYSNFPKSLEDARKNFTQGDLVTLYIAAVENWWADFEQFGPNNKWDQVCSDLGKYIHLYDEVDK